MISFSSFARILERYKYLIVTVVGVALVGFVDEDSIMHRIQLGLQISDLQDQIDHYNEQNRRDTHRLQELNRDPSAIEKIAREHYFMKADDEDIYVLSDDEQPVENKEE